MVGVKVELQSQIDADGNIVQKKKFQCMFCGIFLSTKCYLKNHINAMHTKARVYPCEVCDKYFYSAGALRIHKLRNHWQGSKKHKCRYCGETFLLPIELRKHVLKKHSEVEDDLPPNGQRSDAVGPSSGSSSPRMMLDRPGFPAALMAAQNAVSQGAAVVPMFPGALLHGQHPPGLDKLVAASLASGAITIDAHHAEVAHPAALDKLVAASLASGAITIDTNPEVSVAHSAPVFPSPVQEAIAQASKASIATNNANDMSE